MGNQHDSFSYASLRPDSFTALESDKYFRNEMSPESYRQFRDMAVASVGLVGARRLRRRVASRSS